MCSSWNGQQSALACPRRPGTGSGTGGDDGTFLWRCCCGKSSSFSGVPRWVELIERLQLHTQASILHTCGVAQGLVAALLDKWAADHAGDVHAGFAAKMSEVSGFYKQRCDVFVAAAERQTLARPSL